MKPNIVSIIRVAFVTIVCAMNVIGTDAQMLPSLAQHSCNNEDGVLIAAVKKKKTQTKKSTATNSKNKAMSKVSKQATIKHEEDTDKPIVTKDEPAKKQAKSQDNENDDKNFFSKAKDKITGFFKGDDKDEKSKYKYDKNTSQQELFNMAHELVKEVDAHENNILSLSMDTKEGKMLIKKERDAAHEKRKKAVKIYSEIIKRGPVMGAYLGRGILQMELEKHKQAYSDLEKVLTFDNVPDETKEFCLNCISNEKKMHKENADRRNRILMGVGLGVLGAATVAATTVSVVNAVKHGNSSSSTTTTTTGGDYGIGGGNYAATSTGNSALHPATSQRGAPMTHTEGTPGNGRQMGDVAYYEDGMMHSVLYQMCATCNGSGSGAVSQANQQAAMQRITGRNSSRSNNNHAKYASNGPCRNCGGSGIRILSQKWKASSGKVSNNSLISKQSSKKSENEDMLSAQEYERLYGPFSWNHPDLYKSYESIIMRIIYQDEIDQSDLDNIRSSQEEMKQLRKEMEQPAKDGKKLANKYVYKSPWEDWSKIKDILESNYKYDKERRKYIKK